MTVCRLAKPPSPSGAAAGVAGNDRNILRAHAESFGANLRQRGGKSLPHRRGAGRDRDVAGRRDADIAEFERAAAGAFDAVRQPDADITSRRPRSGLAARKIVPACGAQDVRLAARIIAAVILHLFAGTRFQRFQIRHLFRRDQIAAAQFGAVEFQLVRQPVDHAFHRERRLRIAGAAHR